MSSPARTIHQMPAGSLHKTWNRHNKPVMTIRPGDEVTFRVIEVARADKPRRRKRLI